MQEQDGTIHTMKGYGRRRTQEGRLQKKSAGLNDWLSISNNRKSGEFMQEKRKKEVQTRIAGFACKKIEKEGNKKAAF